MINESLVFESNSYALKSEAKPLLNGLARALGNLLADPDVRENIDAIVIQGHTDERGSPPSTGTCRRSARTAVVDYLFDAEQDAPGVVRKVLRRERILEVPSIDPAQTAGAYQQNRRIEISVIPKDSNIRKIIDDYEKSVPVGL